MGKGSNNAEFSCGMLKDDFRGKFGATLMEGDACKPFENRALASGLVAANEMLRRINKLVTSTNGVQRAAIHAFNFSSRFIRKSWVG